jgi:hypothetical protein
MLNLKEAKALLAASSTNGSHGSDWVDGPDDSLDRAA